jgi:ABC-2 type transport system ATP-binding protein
VGLLLNIPFHDDVALATIARRTGAFARASFSLPTLAPSMHARPGLPLCMAMLNAAHPCARGGPRMNDQIIFEDVSKFYGEVLGVNRISLSIPPGITTLVGPNGSGKTTLMNLMTGLVQPSNGRISVLGLSPGELTRVVQHPSAIARSSILSPRNHRMAVCLRQPDAPRHEKAMAVDLTVEALERVQLGDAAQRKIAGYSKGMRQKIGSPRPLPIIPRVLVLDEPLNGLDPMARAESIALFEELGRQGMHLLISSHILDEVDRISDRVILITGGYLIAEGNIHQVRQEVREKPMQVLIRCDQPSCSRRRCSPSIIALKPGCMRMARGVFLRTGDIDQFYSMLNGIAAEGLGQDRCRGSGRRRCQRHLPISDRHGWEPVMMMDAIANFLEKSRAAALGPVVDTGAAADAHRSCDEISSRGKRAGFTFLPSFPHSSSSSISSSIAPTFWMSDDTNVLAGIVQLYYIRLGVFFGCLGIFSRLIRGEMIERSLHFYLLSPGEARTAAAGKFAAGSISAVLLFGSAIVADFVLMYAGFGAAGSDYIFNGPGLGQLEAYLAIIVLACLGYGAMFLCSA